MPERDAKMQSIEAARAFAALSVLLMHAANLMRVEHFSGHVGLGGLFDFGYVGVDFFFVLSGFIITYVHFADIGSAGRIPRYLWRRFLRVYPIYWVNLMLVMAATTAFHFASGEAFELQLESADIPKTLLLLTGGEPKFVGVAWSLHYEIMFYMKSCSTRLFACCWQAWASV